MTGKHVDAAAERAVLSNLLQGGKDAYLDTIDLINDSSAFSIKENGLIYSCIRYCYDTLDLEKLDLASVFSAAKSLNIDDFIKQTKTQNHLESLFSFAVEPGNLRNFAAKLRRLQSIKIIRSQLMLVNDSLDDFTGDERLSEILAVVEEPIFNLSTKLIDSDDDIKNLTDLLQDYITERIENPVDSIGISSGFPYYDDAIGGGFNGGDVHVICARAKNYKSGFAMTVMKHMASMGVKTLLLDSEMQLREQMDRLLAMSAQVSQKKIKTGQFGQDEALLNQVRQAYKDLVANPYIYHVSTASKPFIEHMAYLRRWYHKHVKDGEPCCVLYDYVKMSSADSGEKSDYDMLGHMVTSLKDFATVKNVPMLALCQQNRTATDDVYSVADSDKITRYATSLSIFRKKTPEEITEDGKHNGNQLLKVCVARNGAGSDGDYINYKIDGEKMSITELGLRSKQESMLAEPSETIEMSQSELDLDL